MKKNRRGSIEAAKKAQNWGVILGTLGRQGNPRILDLLEEKLKNSGTSTAASFPASSRYGISSCVIDFRPQCDDGAIVRNLPPEAGAHGVHRRLGANSVSEVIETSKVLEFPSPP